MKPRYELTPHCAALVQAAVELADTAGDAEEDPKVLDDVEALTQADAVRGLAALRAAQKLVVDWLDSLPSPPKRKLKDYPKGTKRHRWLRRTKSQIENGWISDPIEDLEDK